MKKMLTVFIISCIVASAQSDAGVEYAPNVLLVKVRNPNLVLIDGAGIRNGSADAQAVFKQYPHLSATKIHPVNGETDGWYVVAYLPNAPLETLRSALQRCPDFQYVAFDYYGHFTNTPNDPLWTNPNDYQWALKLIKMPAAWDIATSPNNIVVAVLDGGLDFLHEDLAANVWINPYDPLDGLDNDGNGYVDDIRGWNFWPDVIGNNNIQDGGQSHGTLVAGVIAAKTYNSTSQPTGIAGVAGGWLGQLGARLMGLRVGDNNTSTYVSVRAAAQAISYLTDLRQRHGVKVIANMSFAFCRSDDDLPVLQENIAAAKQAGVIMVASSGNVISGNSECGQPEAERLPPPARWPGVLAIGASEYAPSIADEKRSTYSLYASQLFAVAPVDKPSSMIKLTSTMWSPTHNQYLSTFDGTSAAAPQGAGLIALILGISPNIDYDSIRNVLALTAEKIGTNQGYVYANGRTAQVGYGRINAYKALSRANGSPASPANLTASGYVGQHPTLTWSPNAEPDLAGYKIYRKISPDEQQFFSIASVGPSTTSYTDPGVIIRPGYTTGYWAMYYVKAYDAADIISGPSNTVSKPIITPPKIGADSVARLTLPDRFVLDQNFPNPFNPTTRISCQLPLEGRVLLRVFDVLGRQVARVIEETRAAGYHWLDFDASLVASGVYYLRLDYAGTSSMRKMIVAR